jgi:hypothetical protein
MANRMKKLKLKLTIFDRKVALHDVNKDMNSLIGANNLFGVSNYHRKLKALQKKERKIKSDISRLRGKLKKVI